MPVISISVNDSGVKRMLGNVIAKLADNRPIMRIISEIMTTSVKKNFSVGGRPNRWPASGRAKAEGGQTLSLSGRLKRSITPESGNGWAAVGTNVKYAAIHQFGGKTKPHVIKPRFKKALKTPFGIFKSVKHPGSNIPARPFLMLQDEDMEEIRETITQFLVGR